MWARRPSVEWSVRSRVLIVGAVVFLGCVGAWVFLISPRMADLRYRKAFAGYIAAYSASQPYSILEVWTRTGDGRKMASECGAISVRLGNERKAVAKLDALRHALSGPRKQELAQKLVDSATRKLEYDRVSVEAICDHISELAVHSQPSSVATMLNYQAGSDKADQQAREVVSLWKALDAILYAWPSTATR